MGISFRLENLGVIRQADLALGDLTVVCGKNNTGKTYAAYAVFGFLYYWHYGRIAPIHLPSKLTDQVIREGTATIPISGLTRDFNKSLKKASDNYSKRIHRVFAGDMHRFRDVRVEVSTSGDDGFNTDAVVKDIQIGSAKRALLEIKRSRTKKDISISLFVNKEFIKSIPKGYINDMFEYAVRDSMFKDQLPRPFVASTERTGVAVFQKELDSRRSWVAENVRRGRREEAPPMPFDRYIAGYPAPVRDNLDFIRNIPNHIEEISAFAKESPHSLDRFKKIIGGEYEVSKAGAVYYVPAGKKKARLSMAESSSSVRALLGVGIYLRHIARRGDILVVDEPELNLHPENQRLVAQMLAALVNYGIKVFITTHSDYIISELSTLIMLNANNPRMKGIAKQSGYGHDLLLPHGKVKVYVAEEDLIQLDGRKRRTRCQTLKSVDVSEDDGIAIDSFNKVIDEMNCVQDEIIWGE